MGGFPPALLKQLPKLQWLQTCAAGVEQYCRAEFASANAVLTNGSGSFGIAMAEWAIAGLLMLMRLMPQYARNQQNHIWKCMGLCRSIAGSTITVVGTGDIGTCFAQRAKALGAIIRGVHRTSSPLPACYDENYTIAQLKEAVRDADAVVLCLPGTPETEGVFSGEIISSLSEKTIIVNCGRGKTVAQTALIEALQAHRIAGAVLDVFETEPLDTASPLWDLENVIVTPHISGHDDDPINAEAIFTLFMENMTRYINGEPLKNIVDRIKGY